MVQYCSECLCCFEFVLEGSLRDALLLMHALGAVPHRYSRPPPHTPLAHAPCLVFCWPFYATLNPTRPNRKQIVGNESLCRELAFTGRSFGAAEALRMGFVSRTCGPGSRRTEAVEASLATAAEIARQSPVAVFGTKRNIIYGRDHSVEDGLEYAATWSGAALQAEDFGRAMRAGLSRNKKGAVASHPTFSKL